MMDKKIIISFVVVLVLSNYATYEITKNIWEDKFITILQMLERSEAALTGYKIITESEYKELTYQKMKDLVSEPWWKSNFSDRLNKYPHTNTSELKNMTKKDELNNPIFWIEDEKIGLVWIVINQSGQEWKQVAFIVDDYWNLRETINTNYTFILTFELTNKTVPWGYVDWVLVRNCCPRYYAKIDAREL